MAATIETFLWLARENPNCDLDQTCDVAVAVREAYDEYRYLLKGRTIRTEMVVEDSPTIHAPSAVFKIVINNLLRNAFYYTPEGKIRLTVKNSCIEVFNSGFISISEDIEAVTNPHVRGDESPGFGFGLAIVKRLCERFGWGLDIKSNLEYGTIVTLHFA